VEKRMVAAAIAVPVLDKVSYNINIYIGAIFVAIVVAKRLGR
jgi:hypothetical protein